MSRIGRAFARARATLEGRAVVFMYHRVAEVDVDPWQLAVSPARFDAQLAFVASKYRVVPMQELAQRIRTGRSIRGLAAITFDDGYADNALVAAPLLAKRRLPATYFVTTSVLDGKSRFWWDELEDLLLRRESLPARFESRDGSVAFDLGDDAMLDSAKRAAIADWNASKPHPNRRTEAFHRAWATLRDVSSRHRRAMLDELAEWTGADGHTRIETMTKTMLRDLAKLDGVEIGAHGVTHLALASADPATRGFEIGTSKSTLEDVLHRRVDGFAYPNGDYDQSTTHAVASAGYAYAVTTSGATIDSNAAPFELGRLQVGNWEIARLERSIGKAMEGRVG